jgi:hypothetical protein
MIEIPFSNGHSYQLKNSWEELTTKQYIALLDLIVLFMAGELSLRHFRLKLFALISGVSLRLHPDHKKTDQQCENIWRIAQQLTFPLQVKYKNEKSFSKLKKEVREQLSRYMPFELEQTPEVRWAEKAEKNIVPDLVFAANLVPVIGRRRHTLKGYTFEVSDNILITSLTTSQFIDAQTVALEIQETGKKSLLNLLVAILYGQYRQGMPCLYDAQQSAQLAKTLDWLDLETKKAIFINFNAIQSYLITRTKYSILFNAPVIPTKVGTQNPKHNLLGLGSVAHSLIKAGYGDIKNSNLVEFFEIMYSDLIGNVTSLHKQGHPIDKIAEMTGLTISKINQII